MTVANLLGIPLGTYLSQEFSWRYTFLLIAIFNIAVMASVYFWVPDIRDEAKGKLREQFHFLRSPAPWLIFAATMFGNAGVFAWFSYVKPYMMFISGFSETAMTFIMMLVGLGMVLGNMLSGRISGRYSPLRIAAVTDFIIVLALLMLFFFGGMKTTSLIFAFICCAGLFALSAPLQILLLQNAKGGELLGAAGGQIAFNLGSAVGAYCGGMMLTLGLLIAGCGVNALSGLRDCSFCRPDKTRQCRIRHRSTGGLPPLCALFVAGCGASALSGLPDGSLCRPDKTRQASHQA